MPTVVPKPASSFTVVAKPTSGFGSGFSYLLLELGDFLLQENGDRLILDQSSEGGVVPKPATSWTVIPKPA